MDGGSHVPNLVPEVTPGFVEFRRRVVFAVEGSRRVDAFGTLSADGGVHEFVDSDLDRESLSFPILGPGEGGASLRLLRLENLDRRLGSLLSVRVAGSGEQFGSERRLRLDADKVG